MSCLRVVVAMYFLDGYKLSRRIRASNKSSCNTNWLFLLICYAQLEITERITLCNCKHDFLWIIRTSENCFWNITFLLDGKSIIFLPSTFCNQHHFSHGNIQTLSVKLEVLCRIKHIGRREVSKSMTRKIDYTVHVTSLLFNM